MGATARAARDAAAASRSSASALTYWTGIVTSVTDSTHCRVSSGDVEVPCVVPASLLVNEGASVQIRVRGNDYLVSAVLSGDNQPADLIEQIAAANDPRQASAPTGLTVTPSLVLGADRQWRVLITATWNAVSTATDTTSIEVARYRLWAKSGTGSWRTIAETSGTSIALDGFAPGSTWTFAVTAVPAKLRESDPAGAAAIILPSDTTAPERPSDPAVESAPAAVSVTWDGLDKDGAAMAADLAQVDVLMGTSNPPTDVVASLRDAGTYVGMGEPHTTLWISLVARDTTGNASTATTPVSVVVKSVLDDTELAAELDNRPRFYTAAVPPGSETPPENSWWFKTDATVWRYISGVWTQQTFDASQTVTAGTIITALLAAAAVTADKIAANAVTTDKLYASAVTAAKIATGAITADKISAGAIDGFLITGATVRTAASGARVVLDSSGLKAYNSSGSVVSSISATTGAFSATSGTFTGTISSSDITGGTITGTTYKTAGSGIRAEFSTDGTLTYYKNDGSLGTMVYLAASPVGQYVIQNISGAISVSAASSVGISPGGSEAIYLDGPVKVKDNPTTNAATARLTALDANGRSTLQRNTSLRAYKKVIEDLDIEPAAVLGLRPRSWFDRTEIIEAGLDPAAATEGECIAAGLRRVPGFVAEEVAETVPILATYGPEWLDDGNGSLAPHEALQGVAYDRVSAALLVLAKDQQARIETLEATVADIAARLDKIA